MRLVHLVMENFMGFVGEHGLALDDLGLCHVAGINLDDPANTSNGAGKSTILEALTWGLFGEGLPRRQGNSEQGIRADEPVSDQVGKQCRVTVHLDDEAGGLLTVERWRKWKDGAGKATNGARLTVNGTVREALDVAETDRQIQECLGITREIWARTVIFGQESAFNFCESTAGERSDILTTVMGLEAVDGWLEKCRDEKHALKMSLAEAGGRLTQMRDTLAYEQGRNLAQQAAAWEADHAQRLTGLSDGLAALEGEGKALRGQLEGFGSPPEVPPGVDGDPDLAALRQQIDVVSDRSYQQQTAAGMTGAEVRRLEGERVRVANLNSGAACPTCLQAIGAEHLAGCLAKIDGELATARAARAGQTEVASQSAEQLAKLKEAWENRAQVARQARALASLKEREYLFEKGEVEGRLKATRDRWQAAKRDLEAARSAVNPIVAMIAQQEQRIAELTASLAAVEGDHDRMSYEFDLCQWWERELPRFKTWMFDSVVDVLAAEANRWLGIMSGGVIWIKISTQVKKSKGLKDELGVEVFRWMPDGTVVSRPYRVWSGGEKRRIALAVDLGLSRLMSLRAAKAYRFLGLDEIDRHLDERGREGLRMVLEELRTERDSVLCITHDQAFRASFDGEIRVTKQGGKSRLESARVGE